MKGKLLFVVGLATGYVLGTRAGRERYDQIAQAAKGVWNAPTVQQGVGAAKDFALARVGDVSEVVLDGAKKFISQNTKGRSDAKSAVDAAARAAGRRAADVKHAADEAIDDIADRAESAASDIADAAEQAKQSAASARKPAARKPAARKPAAPKQTD
ncbi:hypothetical protein [Agromyces seonyuensis]|uniref:hypothetical protein n=1 Tax=Agromyces seonyuensis TaxID=2662446 RepID=UPI001F36EA8D|nr:hypothetical protein [Agromyces seonyuensis]